MGYNPVVSIISQLPHSIAATLSSQVVSTLTGLHWFPTAIATSFMSSLHIAFYISAGLAGAAAIASLLRGKRYIHDAALGEAPAKAQMSSGKASEMNSTVKTDA